MDRREAKRRARWATAQLVEEALASGWELQRLTDDDSDKQEGMILEAFAEVLFMLRCTLPEGYESATFLDRLDKESL